LFFPKAITKGAILLNESDLAAYIESYPGLCLPGDCFILYSLVSELECHGDVLEIGAFKGRTAIVMAKGLADRARDGFVYTLESNLLKTKDELTRNIEKSGLSKRIRVIFDDSLGFNRSWSGPLKFIWIDTDGNYLSALSDFILWERFLNQGGVIAFSCVSNQGIQKIVKKHLIDSGRFCGITFSKEICFAFKEKQGKHVGVLKILYIQIIYGLYLSAKKILYRLNDLMPAFSWAGIPLKRVIKKLFDRFL
jgi:predicted O-methyltransferase YrrM